MISEWALHHVPRYTTSCLSKRRQFFLFITKSKSKGACNCTIAWLQIYLIRNKKMRKKKSTLFLNCPCLCDLLFFLNPMNSWSLTWSLNAKAPFWLLLLLQAWNPLYTAQCHFHLQTKTYKQEHFGQTQQYKALNARCQFVTLLRAAYVTDIACNRNTGLNLIVE